MTPEDFQEKNALDQPTNFGFQDPTPQPKITQDPVKAPPGYAGVDLNIVKPEFREDSIRSYFQNKQSEDAIVNNMRDAIRYRREEYYDAKKKAQTLGITVESFMDNKESVKDLYQEISIRNANFQKNSPILAELLQDRDAAIRSQSAVDNFSYLERTWLAWSQGEMTVRRGELGSKMMNNTLSSEEKAELDEINRTMEAMPPAAGEILPEAARVFGLQAAMTPESVGTGLVTGGLAAAGGAIFGGVGAGPAFVTGYFWGSAAGSAYKMYEIESGNTYADMIDMGIDPVKAASESKWAGMLSSAVEFALAPLGGAGFRRAVNSRLIKKIYGDEVAEKTAKMLFIGKGRVNKYMQAAQDYGAALLSEPSEEYIQTWIQEYATKAAIAASGPEFRAKMDGMGNKELESQAADAFVNTFWGMIAGAAPQAFFGYSGAVRRANIAKEQGEAIQIIAEIASKAPADPAVTKRLVTRLSDKYGNGDLSISSSDLLSVLDDMAKSVEASTGKTFGRDDAMQMLKKADPDMYQSLVDVIKTGKEGEVLLKTSDFVSKYVERDTSTFYRDLIKHLRVVQGDATVPLSLNEAQNMLKKIEDLQRRNMELYEKEEKPFQEAAINVRKQLKEELDKNTALPQNVKDVTVELLMANILTTARRDRRMPEASMAGRGISFGQVGAAGMTEEQFNAQLNTPDALLASSKNSLWSYPEQEITSADTSINKNKLPATFSRVEFQSGTVNADIGGGQFDNGTEFLSEKGVTNVIYDPFNRSKEHNEKAANKIKGGKADTATVNNVLNVIKEPQNRLFVISQAADAVKKDGTAYFLIYDGDRSGNAKQTKQGWQENRKASTYVDEVSQKFSSVEVSGNLIIAKNPIKGTPLKASTPATSGLKSTAAYIPNLNRIILSKNATLREVVHEIGHMVLEDIMYRAHRAVVELANGRKASFVDIEIANEIASWMGLTAGKNAFVFESFEQLPADKRNQLHEMLAYNYETYMQSGKAPTKKLQSLFRKIGEMLRAFWGNIKNSPASIYKEIYKEDLPILSSPAARALDMTIAIEDQIESSDIANDISLVSMSKDEAVSVGISEDDWDEIQKLKHESVSASVDEAIAAQFGNSKWYSRAIRAQNEKYQRFVNKERARIYEEQKAELRKLGVHNVRGWMLDGTAYDSDGKPIDLYEDIGNRISSADVKAAHAKLAEGLAYEIAQVKARIKKLDPANKIDATEIKMLEEYISLAKSVLKVGTTPVLASANRIFTLGRNALAASSKSIEQFKSELLAAMTTTALRTVRRSPLYVFQDIRSLVRAADEAKLSEAAIEEAVYTLLTTDKSLNGFRASASLIVGTARKAEKQTKFGFARTAQDLMTALRIQYVKEAIEDSFELSKKKLEAQIATAEEKVALLTKQYNDVELPRRNKKDLNNQINTATKELASLRNEYNRYISGKRKTIGDKTIQEMLRIDAELDALYEEYEAITPQEYEAKTSAIYAKISAAQSQLEKLLQKEAKSVLTKEMLARIEEDVVEQVAVNYPELSSKLKDADIRASVMEAVNRRIARQIRQKFFADMTSTNGVTLADHRSRMPGKITDEKAFVLAVIQSKQQGNDEDTIARERAEAKLDEDFGKVATRMHVEAGAEDLIKQVVEEESVENVYSDMIADDGVPLDLVREMFGYSDNDSLLFELLTSPEIEDVALEYMEGIVARTPELSDKKVRDSKIAEAINNQLRVDILKTEIRAAQNAVNRVYEAGLSPEELKKRKDEQEAARVALEAMRGERDKLKDQRDEYKKVGDTVTADLLDERIDSMNKDIRKLAIKAGSALVTSSEANESALQAARVRLNRTLVGRVKASVFLTAARRAERTAVNAMKKATSKKGKSDYLYEYVEAKVEQLLYEKLHREALAAERKMKQDMDFVASIFGEKMRIAGERNYDYVLAARAILTIYGFRQGDMDQAIAAVDQIKEYDPLLHEQLIRIVRVSLFEASDVSLNAMQTRVIRAAEGEENEKELPPIYRDLTWEQYSHLLTNVRTLWDQARAVKKVDDEKEAKLLQAKKDNAFLAITTTLAKWREARARLSKIPIVGWFMPSDADGAKDPSRVSRVSMQYLARNKKMESFFLELDGDKVGFFTREVWRPISNASDNYSLQAAEFHKRYLALIEPLRDKLSAVREIKADELTDKDGNAEVFGKNGGRGLSELFWVLTHIGNMGNYRRMIVGCGWGTITDGVLDDSKWIAFYERAKRDGLITDEMLDAIQGVWDLFEELRPEYKRAYRKARDIAFVDVEATEVKGVTKTYRGGYVPAEVDPKIRDKAVSDADMDNALALLRDEGAGNAAPFIPEGRGRDRNENYEQYARKLATDHLFIPRAMEQMVRFIHLYEPLSNAVALLKDERVSGAINQYHHNFMSDAVIPWINDIAVRSSAKQSDDTARALAALRTAQVGVQMFFNVKVAVENISGLFPAMAEVHAKHVLAAIPAYLKRMSDAKKEISDKSKFMRNYHRNAMFEIAIEIRDFLEKGGKLANVQEWFRNNTTFLVKQTQDIVSDLVWLGMFNQVMADSTIQDPAAREAEAIQRADSVVRLTQNSYRIEDKTVLERGGEMAKMAATYTGWFNMIRQLFSRKAKQALLDGTLAGATASTGWYFLVTLTIPSMISAALVAVLYDSLGDDDEEKRDEFINELLWMSTLRTSVSGFPIVGQLTAQVLDSMAGKNYGKGFGENPIIGGLGRQFTTLGKLLTIPTEEGEWTGRDTKVFADTISMVLGIPPVGRQLGYLQAAATGEEEVKNLPDFIRGMLTGVYQK